MKPSSRSRISKRSTGSNALRRGAALAAAQNLRSEFEFGLVIALPRLRSGQVTIGCLPVEPATGSGRAAARFLRYRSAYPYSRLALQWREWRLHRFLGF